MKTIIRIDGLHESGAGVPLYQSILDGDFVPRVGDFVTARGLPYESQVTKVVYQYAVDPKQNHVVTVTVQPVAE